MAKKKPQTHKPQDQDKIHHHHQAMGDDASEKLDSLKSLNARLLKETVERRQQVDSLVQSNGYLKSELNRSVMGNDSLQSQLNALTERSLMLEIEKGLVSVFVTAQVNQMAEVSDGFCRERVVMEERIEFLEGDMKRVLEEKSEIEKLKESEIGDLNRRLDELIEERVVFSRVCDERDDIRVQLDGRIQMVNELQLKAIEAEKREAQILEEVDELKGEYDRLMEENAASGRRIESITSEKDSILKNLIELNGVVDDLKRNMAKLLEQKTTMEDEKAKQETKNDELQTSVTELNDLVQSMRIEQVALLGKIADLEKKYAASLETEGAMRIKIDELVTEKKETEGQIESTMKDLEDAVKKLEHQKLTINHIVEEKTEMEEAKIRGEGEIARMQEQLSVFEGTISSLENCNTDQNEKLKGLKIEVSHYKDSLDQAIKERDEAKESLNSEKAITTDFKQKITSMERGIKDLQEELAKTTAAHLEEKEELVKEVAETQIEFDDTKGKLRLTEAKLKRVLDIFEENSDLDQENGVKDDVEEIRRGFKDKVKGLEEMKRQVELFKNSAAEAHKEKSFWTMVSSATAILAAAAVSVAYVARAH